MNDFERLIERLISELREMCRNAMPCEDAASEVLQRSLMEAHRDYHQCYSPTGEGQACWLRRIIRNNILDYRRELARRRRRETPSSDLFDLTPAPPEPAAEWQQVESFVRFAFALSKAAGHHERKVARAFQGLLYAEGVAERVAEKWGIQPPTFHRHKTRMLEAIGEILDRDLISPEEIIEATRFMQQYAMPPSREAIHRWVVANELLRNLDALQRYYQELESSDDAP